MTARFLCVSHAPPLPSPWWEHEDLERLLAARAGLVEVANVPGVELPEAGQWLVWHPACDVLVDGDVSGRPHADIERPERSAEEPPVEPPDKDEAQQVEPAGDPAVESPVPPSGDAQTAAPVPPRGRRLPRGMPEPPWVCGECTVELDEQQAILSWSRWRALLCTNDLEARSIKSAAS